MVELSNVTMMGIFYTSLLGNNDGPEVWCTYTINVLEDGDYDAFMFYSNEANKPFWLSVDGGEKVEGKTGIGGVGTGNWDSLWTVNPCHSLLQRDNMNYVWISPPVVGIVRKLFLRRNKLWEH